MLILWWEFYDLHEVVWLAVVGLVLGVLVLFRKHRLDHADCDDFVE